jgi:hypothetical protein
MRKTAFINQSSATGESRFAHSLCATMMYEHVGNVPHVEHVSNVLGPLLPTPSKPVFGTVLELRTNVLP